MPSLKATVPAGLFGLIFVSISPFLRATGDLGAVVGFLFLAFGAVLCLVGLVGKGTATKALGLVGLLIALYLFSQMRL